MQSGHAQDVAELSWAAPSYSTGHGRRSSSSRCVHFQCCDGWASGRPAGQGRPDRAGPDRSSGGTCCGPDRTSGRLSGLLPSLLGGAGRAGPGLGPGQAPGVSASGGGGCGATRLRVAGLRPHCSHPSGSWFGFLRCSVRVWAGVLAVLSFRLPRSSPASVDLRRRARPAGGLAALRSCAAPGFRPLYLLRAVG